MSSQAPVRIGSSAAVEDDEFELAGYCSRPSCRKQFQQATGPGRRREFCSDICRRHADKEYKRAQAAVVHFTRLLERSRFDVAAFGRDDEDEVGLATPEAQALLAANASAAIDHAELFLELVGEPDERALRELRKLITGVRPFVQSSAEGRSTA